ncbi:NusA-like transcription termination signal-binding factor [Candidatus Woesearchaeota archaeon]|nr:NusA-like transcription termination signal-binding factor [Candidatus Woesearchaeota archaeon]
MQYITLFESLTTAKVKDCFVNEKLTYVIEKGQMGLAIGKQGRNLRNVERALKKELKVVEFDDNIGAFIKNYVYPLRKFSVAIENKIITITGEDVKTKGLLIGRDRANLKHLMSVLKRYFDIDDIKVE